MHTPRLISVCGALAALLMALLGGGPGDQDPFDDPMLGGPSRTHVELAWYEGNPVPGTTATLGVILDVMEGWHIQAGKGSPEEPESYIATTIDLSLPQGWGASAIQWPPATTFTLGAGDYVETLEGYEHRSIAIIAVEIPETVEPGEYPVQVTVSYQACDDFSCEPDTTVTTSAFIEVVPPGTAAEPVGEELAQMFEATLAHNAERPEGRPDRATGSGASAPPPQFIILLLLAIAGGFLLNLTPCVLPVIPIKIMSLAKSAGNRQKTLALGVVMCLGIIAFWLGIGVAITSLNEFTATNELFQYPAFPISIGILIVILAVGMCGIFTVQLPQWVYRINPSHDTYHGSFGFGVMVAVLSTPCTAPFMGFAAAAAVGQSTVVVLSVFMAIGAGMALPYFVLAAFPRLVDRMPRTGPASELIKQVMGICMLAAGAFFIGVGVSALAVQPPAPPSKAYWWPVFALLSVAGLWLAWRTLRITSSPVKRMVFVGLGVATMIGSVIAAPSLARHDEGGPIAWVYYTPEALEEALANGDVVIIDFTAEWCINCKVLEKGVLESDAVAERIREDDVTAIKVDITSRTNELGRAKLRETGSLTIPWLVVLSPNGEPTFAQNWYTAEMVLDAIERASQSRVASRGQ